MKEPLLYPLRKAYTVTKKTKVLSLLLRNEREHFPVVIMTEFRRKELLFSILLLPPVISNNLDKLETALICFL